MKDIKVKESNVSISTLDKKETLHHYTKQNDVKKNPESQSQNHDETSDPAKRATASVVGREKKTAVESAYMAKRYAKKIQKKRQSRIKDDENGGATGKEPYIKEKQADIKDKSKDVPERVKIKDKESCPNQAKRINTNDNKPTSLKTVQHRENKIKTKSVKKTSHSVSFRNVNKHDYQKQMHFFHIRKHKQKVKETKETAGKIKQGVQHLGNSIKTTFKVAKVAVTSIQNIISIGGAFILLVVIALFLGVFSALSDDSSVNTAIQPVSAEVLAYSDTVAKYAKEYDIEDYIGLINAVMMQESAGKGNDPMQASECSFNLKYPNKPNGITDPEYSIQVGIQNLADCMQKSKVKNTTDIKHISLALQAYNFGQAYIEWAVTNFDGYTRANAKVYSDQKKAELKTNIYGDPQYVPHVLQYYHIGNGSLVQIAQSQIGNIGGRPYWSWYGFHSRVEWCACFVSWCANEAGLIDKGIVPKFAYCPTGIQWFKDHGQWQSRMFTPAPGDIIFFDWQNDGVSDHVGIVEKVGNGIVYTIEGNSTNDGCRQNKYHIGSIYIYGYGTIKNE
ncbi:lysozyme family protein [[Eubacterium] hominis]|uniref:lysozyme family protein n=1 Tax=[Eubacterium] hominis TaxID=2764325 RepID=UPI003A4DCED2